jgi:hypothetical protein
MVLTMVLSFKVAAMVQPIASGSAYFQQEEDAKFDPGHVRQNSVLDVSSNGSASAYAYAIKDA